jgi:hypothetical protein
VKALKLVFAAALLASMGCHDASKDIEKFADRACACGKDAACGEKVLNEFAAWAKDNKEARGDQDKAKAAAERLLKCTMDSGVPVDKLSAAMSGLQ